MTSLPLAGDLLFTFLGVSSKESVVKAVENTAKRIGDKGYTNVILRLLGQTHLFSAEKIILDEPGK